MTAPSQEYSPTGYVRLISALVDIGYESVRLGDVVADRPCLFLRHDVDMCLDRAVVFAEAEHAAGISSTYYVLIRTEMYNVMSRAGRAAVRRIAALGHEVGLHFDSFGLPPDLETLTAEAECDCEVLENALDQRVASISFHRPSERLQGLAADIAGRPHVYQPRYFKEIGYCSDSAGGFKHHHPTAHPSVLKRQALQLLTHPIWWVAEDGTPLEKLDRFVGDRISSLKRELAFNCKVYAYHES